MSAAPALTLEEEEAEQRDVVVGPDEAAAIGTPGAWDDDILAERDSMDAHITKASDNESQHKTYAYSKGTMHGLPH